MLTLASVISASVLMLVTVADPPEQVAIAEPEQSAKYAAGIVADKITKVSIKLIHLPALTALIPENHDCTSGRST